MSIALVIFCGAGCVPPGPPISLPPQGDSPRIVVTEPVYDFGTVAQGEKVTHVFRLHNAGTRYLHIDDATTSCSCTAAIISSKVIPPGSEGAVEATFDTSRYLGKKTRTLSVYTNDPDQPRITLALTGNIGADVVADPPQLYFGRVRRGEEVTKEMAILFSGDTQAQVTAVENSHPSLVVRSEDLRDPVKQGKRLVVQLREDIPPGRFNDQITVRTTSPKHPALKIPAFGSVEGDLQVRPPQLSFGVIEKGQSPSQEVSLKNLGVLPVRITRVSDSRLVSHEIVTVRPGEEYRVTVSLKGDLPKGQVRGKLHIYTDHPQEQVISIPIYGMVKD